MNKDEYRCVTDSCGPSGAAAPGVLGAGNGFCSCAGAQHLTIAPQILGIHFLERNLVRRVTSKSERKH